jgi:hypothetical protein
MDRIETYFRAEKKESALFIAVGAIFLAAAAFLDIATRDEWFHGLAAALGAFALIEVFVGLLVFFRTDVQLRDLLERFASDAPKMKQEEFVRMRPVNLAFVVYRYGEIASLLVGAALIAGIASPSDYWQGFGLGLFVQGAVTLFMDSFAARRAKVYTAFLSS